MSSASYSLADTAAAFSARALRHQQQLIGALVHSSEQNRPLRLGGAVVRGERDSDGGPAGVRPMPDARQVLATTSYPLAQRRRQRPEARTESTRSKE